MTAFTLTATATDSVTGQTGQGTQAFTTGSTAGIVPVSAGPIALSLSPAFGRATAAGNLLVARAAVNSSSATFPITTSSPGWVLAGPGGGAFQWSSLWYKPNCAANETAPVFNGGSTVNFSQLAEYSGAVTSAVLDRVAAATGDQVITALAPGSDTQAQDLAVVVAFWNSSAAGGTVSLTSFTDSAGSPITGTLVQAAQGNARFATLGGIAGNTGSAADKAVMALSVFSNGSGVIATFKAASGQQGTLAITPSTVPAIWQGFPYPGKPLTATGGVPPYTWTVASGTLPAGTSLSAAGVISGTCTTAGTYNFTARVTDSAAHTATAALSSVINPPPGGAALVSTSASSSNLGPFGGTVSGSGFPGNTGFNDYVTQNDQGLLTGFGGAQTIRAYDLSHFYAAVNALPQAGAVQTYPSNQVSLTSYGPGGLGTGSAVTPLSAFATLTGTFSVIDPDDGNFECAYDIWTNYPVDIMIWTDISPDRGNGGAQLLTPNLSFSGRMWDLYRWGGPGTELMFMLQGAGGSGTYGRMQSGTLDIRAFLQYCQDSGLVPAPLTLSIIGFGWEVCQTNGPENFICAENHMNWT